jgi:hypothetical protein
MMEADSQGQPGATVAPKGVDVLLSVQGVSVGQDQAEILISTAEARRLAMRLLQLADEQERQLERLRNYQKSIRGHFRLSKA